MKRRLLTFFVCSLISITALYTLWAFLGRSQTLPEPDISADHKLECVSYTSLMNNEKPAGYGVMYRIPPDRIDRDLKLLSQRFSCVRIYNMAGYEDVPGIAKKYGLKLILSAWIGPDLQANDDEIKSLIETTRRYKDIIMFVLVGNETLLRHEQTESQMIDLVKRVKAELPDVPVSYGEVLGFWKHYERLAEVVDFLTIHILPYWSNVPPRIGDVADYVEWDYNQMVKQYPGKKFFVGEIGWPSQGRTREYSAPSPVNEARFFRAVIPRMEKLGWHYCVIEAFDQPWKRNNEGCVGGYWGVFDANRQSKNIFDGRVSNEPLWGVLFKCSAALAVVFCGFIGLIGRIGPIGPIGLMNGRRIFVAVLFSTLAAFALVKQGREFQLSAFNQDVMTQDALYLLLGLVGACLAVWVAVAQKVPERLDWTGIEEALRKKQFFSAAVWTNLFEQVVVFFLVTISVSLIFVGRSQSFIGFALLMPVLFILTRAFRNRDHERIYLQDFILGIALFVIVICLANNERLWNSQANLWMVVCLAASVSLLQIFSLRDLKAVWQRIRLRIISKYLAWFAFVWLAILFLRYSLMESRYCNLDILCGNNPSAWYCSLRDTIGISIAWKLWGIAAVIALLVAVLSRSFKLTFVSLLMALA